MTTKVKESLLNQLSQQAVVALRMSILSRIDRINELYLGDDWYDFEMNLLRQLCNEMGLELDELKTCHNGGIK